MNAHPAEPRHDIGDVVTYTDHHGRAHQGEVRRIEATWSFRGRGKPPLIGYTIWHPTYRNNQCHVSEDRVRPADELRYDQPMADARKGSR